MCEESLPSAALFVTMVGHKRRVRLNVEGLPCAPLAKMLKSGRSKLHRRTTITKTDNLSMNYEASALVVSLVEIIMMEKTTAAGLIGDFVDFQVAFETFALAVLITAFVL